jgi:hypothetical protein
VLVLQFMLKTAVIVATYRIVDANRACAPSHVHTRRKTLRERENVHSCVVCVCVGVCVGWVGV